MEGSRDTCVFLAKLAEQAERYDEMVSRDRGAGEGELLLVLPPPPSGRQALLQQLRGVPGGRRAASGAPAAPGFDQQGPTPVRPALLPRDRAALALPCRRWRR